MFAIATGEKQQSVGDDSHEALYRIEYNIEPAEEENFLRAIVNQDPAYLGAKTAAERKNAAKNARYRGRILLREQLKADYEKKITMEQFQERVRKLKEPGVLFKELCGRAQGAMGRIEEEIQGLEDDVEEEMEGVEEYVDIGERLGVQLADERLGTNEASRTENNETPDEMVANFEIDGETSGNLDIPYDLQVRSFLECLLEPREVSDKPEFGRKVPGNGFTCGLCELDESTSTAQKEKLWPSASALKKHQDSDFHTGISAFYREMHKKNPSQKDFICPYPGCDAKKPFGDLTALRNHLVRTGRYMDESDHSVAIRRDGWLEAGFFQSKAAAAGRPKTSHRKRAATEPESEPESTEPETVPRVKRLTTMKVLKEIDGVPIILCGPNPVPQSVMDMATGKTPLPWLPESKEEREAAKQAFEKRAREDPSLGIRFGRRTDDFDTVYKLGKHSKDGNNSNDGL
ncbi:hypothetical protein CJF30_00007638 [Rutstroemia sp. NJR-2017a BBW]|nr:hypothetical protein CJF30_00007638 [Rutstroemia sp. NJR-2017a BBW]